MLNDRGKTVRDVPPSHPVEITGLDGVPDVGELFVAMEEERIAREIASRRADRRRMKELSSGTSPRHVSLEGLHGLVAEGKLKELKIILKADVQGSLEAVAQSLTKLSNEEVRMRILHRGTGGITESDVTLAAASDAVVVCFNVRPDAAALALADREGVDIKTYRLIYEIIEEFQKALIGMLEKRYKEIQDARVEIRQLFKISRLGTIGGSYVLEGEISRHSRVRLVRNGVVVYDGKLASLRRLKDDASKVAAGYECGLMLENYNDLKEGDIAEAYHLEEIPAELVASTV
jgi:translation initiation factor IF-2